MSTDQHATLLACCLISHIIRKFLYPITYTLQVKMARQINRRNTQITKNTTKTLFHLNWPYDIPFNGDYYHTLVQMLKRLNLTVFRCTFTFTLSHVFVYISYCHSTYCRQCNILSSLIKFSDILDKQKVMLPYS